MRAVDVKTVPKKGASRRRNLVLLSHWFEKLVTLVVVIVRNKMRGKLLIF